MHKLAFGAVAALAATAALWSGIALADSADTVPQARSDLHRAATRLEDYDVDGALTLLELVIDGPVFDKLTTAEQHKALQTAAGLEFNNKNIADALSLLTRATKLPEATSQDWWMLLAASQRRSDAVTSAQAVAAIARQWPDVLDKIDRRSIAGILEELRAHPEARDARFQLLSSLYDARWPHGRMADFSYLWRDLALMLLEDGQADRAAEVAKSIRSPQILVAVRSDRRFDAIVQSDPSAFDLQAAMDAAIADAKARVAAEPDKLDDVRILASALIKAGKDSDALTLIDDTLAKAEEPSRRSPIRRPPSIGCRTPARRFWLILAATTKRSRP